MKKKILVLLPSIVNCDYSIGNESSDTFAGVALRHRHIGWSVVLAHSDVAHGDKAKKAP